MEDGHPRPLGDSEVGHAAGQLEAVGAAGHAEAAAPGGLPAGGAARGQELRQDLLPQGHPGPGRKCF